MVAGWIYALGGPFDPRSSTHTLPLSKISEAIVLDQNTTVPSYAVARSMAGPTAVRAMGGSGDVDSENCDE